MEVFIPKLLGWNIDALEKDHRFYFRFIIMLIATFGLQFFCRVLWRRTLAMQSFRAARDLKINLWDRTRLFPLDVFHKKFTRGDLINLSTSDVTSAQNTLGFHFVTSTDFFFLFTLSLASMLAINVRLTLISLALFPVIPFFVYFICEKESKLYDLSQRALSRLNDTIDAIVGAAKLMKLRPQSPLWNKNLSGSAQNYQKRRKELLITETNFYPATALPPAFAVAFFLFFGLRSYQQGQLTLGQVVAFHSYLFMIADPLSELGWLISDWQKSFSSLRRLLALFGQKDDPIFTATEAPKALAIPLKIEGLAFSYSDKPLITLNSLQLKFRERLGIRGDVASGKSTLGRIISGLELRYQGEVTLFGTEVKTLENSQLRKLVSLVDQNPFLFGATIRENISLDRAFTDQEIWHWLEVVDLADDFRKTPGGLDAHLGEWGINLSGGQRQRLTLARALARQPDLLILDDALSAVDVVTEARIVAKLSKVLVDLTTIVISHRPSSLALCDRVVELVQVTT